MLSPKSENTQEKSDLDQKTYLATKKWTHKSNGRDGLKDDKDG
jgi:hypothetical protein